MFSNLNSLVQRFGSVVIQHRHGLLADDWAGVHARIHEMHGAAGHLHTMRQRLFPGLQAGERRQQRRVDINNPPGESVKERLLQHPHEPSQRHQIHLGFPQRFDVRPLCFLIQLRAELARGHEPRRNAALACSREDSRLRHVAQYQRDLRRHGASPAGIGNGHEVGALA